MSHCSLCSCKRRFLNDSEMDGWPDVMQYAIRREIERQKAIKLVLQAEALSTLEGIEKYRKTYDMEAPSIGDYVEYVAKPDAKVPVWTGRGVVMNIRGDSVYEIKSNNRELITRSKERVRLVTEDTLLHEIGIFLCRC